MLILKKEMFDFPFVFIWYNAFCNIIIFTTIQPHIKMQTALDICIQHLNKLLPAINVCHVPIIIKDKSKDDCSAQ